MTQCLNALAALLGDPSLNLNTYMVAHSLLQFQFQVIQCPLLTSIES